MKAVINKQQSEDLARDNLIIDGLKNKLKHHYSNNLFRSRLKNIAKQAVNQKGLLNFCSNDYLGFATNAEIIKKVQDLLPSIGLGSGASNMICGYHTIHQDLENTIAQTLKCDQAILFPSGYMANLAIADVLLNIDAKNSVAIHDHNNHASILDGSRLAGAKLARYQHNNLDHLEVILNKYANRNKFIFTESLFSMDGDFADLPALFNIAAKNTNTCVVIDESHSFGLYESQRGKNIGLSNVLTMGTFGKAFGASGAFVAGPKIFIESLIQFARPYIYTTNLSPVMAATALYGIKLNQQTAEFREQLFTNIAYFCEKLEAIGISTNPNSPIQPIVIGDNQRCIAAAEHLRKNNILVTAIRPPTVQPNKARLRITLSANHSHADIDHLTAQLAKLHNENFI